MITQLSNSLDSTRRAKSEKPVLVSLKQNNSNYEFSVEDWGLGIDDTDVREILSKYGKSTKRNLENELGYWGFGWKSPLSYATSFTFIGRKDGIERTYMMYRGEEQPQIDLLSEKKTEEPNGVKVTVPVNWYDKQTFLNKIKEQLCYFENVYFDVNVSGATIDNGFKISRYTHFQMSELSNDRNMHICLDNVYYPIDYSKLGISSIRIPIGLRFSLTDGIYPILNRESVRYTKEAKEIMIDKIKEASKEIMDMYNDTISDSDDIKAIVQ